METEKNNHNLKTTRAFLKNLPITPRKVRLVTATVKDKPISEVLNILEHTPKRAALPLMKLLNSAIANATNNQKLNFNQLSINTIRVNEGRKLKRFRPRAKGATYSIWKRSSHVEIVLVEKKTEAKIVAEKGVKDGTKS